MVLYDSRNETYKTPFGALRAGQIMRLYIEITQPVEQMHFVIAPDAGKERVLYMTREGNGWSISFTEDKAGLYFYRFEAVRSDGTYIFIGRGDGGKAVIGDWLPRWSLTVYAADFTTPAKFAGGVMYQIFPDRFARISSKQPDAAVRSTRFFHADTTEAPYEYGDSQRPGGLDYYGGSLAGVREKLPYLKSLGVTVIYFNPIFESAENHRYSTSDYLKIDPYFGTEQQFKEFCAAAEKEGISVILDGVFSHTGADSVYFNRYSHYDSVGAYNSTGSPYFDWYDFTDYPDGYTAWWGFKNLPNVKETSPSYLEFITGEHGVLEHWQKAGGSGWRLDVADELPDAFLEAVRRRVKTTDPDALIIGEVWENAVEKFSYGARRRFLLGEQCDSVMNYPWRETIIQLVRTGNVSAFAESVQSLCEDYPAPSQQVLMNVLSTHDTKRILTELGVNGPVPQAAKRDFRLMGEAEKTAVKRVKTAAILQFTLPGIPSVYYGDEIGMQGFEDPYNRAFFDEEKGNGTLLAFYRRLGQIRGSYRKDFTEPIRFLQCENGILHYTRGQIHVWLNFSGGETAAQGECLLRVDADGCQDACTTAIYRCNC